MAENTEPRGDAELARVRVVERYGIVDMPVDVGVGRIAALAAQFFDAPMATVSIVDRDRIWFAAAHGLGQGVRQVARDDGLCASVILSDTPFAVNDALTDSRTANNRFVHEHQIRFYAGAPLLTFDGYLLERWLSWIEKRAPRRSKTWPSCRILRRLSWSSLSCDCPLLMLSA
jgi:sigma-B regulation protein RsbU (phosphoserine phosphatase)